jgi:polyisoprenoid-binding protein YceI
VVVDVTSGNSGSEARDRRMHSTVLESERYPDATFVPLRIEGKLAMPGASRVRLIGTFTILGVAHELSMDVQSTVTGDQIRAVIRFEIPYVAWGMKDPSNFLLKVDKKVPVLIEATGSLQKH